MSAKVFQIVTDRICDMLKAGTVPWKKPWKANSIRPCNISGREYNGINFFMLGMLPFSVPVYLTLNQIKQMGGTIKDGENKRHAPVFYWEWPKEKDAQGNVLPDARAFPMCRYTQVWNIDQVDGIELPKKFKSEAPAKSLGTVAMGEEVIKGYNGPAMKVGGTRACYSPMYDTITMPEKDTFTNVESYYNTLFHEMTHSTGHKSRLNRKELMDANAFGSHDYSVEELVAEMGAAYLSAHCGMDNTLGNSAAYISGWLTALKDKPRMLMDAAARAQKAFDHITGKPPYVADAD